MKGLVVLLDTKKLCYDSSASFQNSMGIEFKQRGYDIVFYDPFTMSDNDLDAMVKKEAIAVIDVNSIITNAIWRKIGRAHV